MAMTWFQTLILGLVQGLTEFLPISSSWSFALLLIRQAASASVLSRASVIFAGSRA